VRDATTTQQLRTERGSVKVAKGKQAAAKAKRRSSSMQCNKQPTTNWRTKKVARAKQPAQRSCAMQQPTNNQAGISKGCKGEASHSKSKEKGQQCATQQTATNKVRNGKASSTQKQSGGAAVHHTTTNKQRSGKCQR
jgi:hypothetical protein